MISVYGIQTGLMRNFVSLPTTQKKNSPFHTIAESRRANKLKHATVESISLTFWVRVALRICRVEIWDMIRSRMAKEVWFNCCGSCVWNLTVYRNGEMRGGIGVATHGKLFIHPPCQKCRQANSIPTFSPLLLHKDIVEWVCILQFRFHSWPQESTIDFSAKSMIKG